MLNLGTSTYVGGGGVVVGGGTGLCTRSCKTFHQCYILTFALTAVLSEGKEGNARSDIAKHWTFVLYFNIAVGAMP